MQKYIVLKVSAFIEEMGTYHNFDDAARRARDIKSCVTMESIRVMIHQVDGDIDIYYGELEFGVD